MDNVSLEKRLLFFLNIKKNVRKQLFVLCFNIAKRWKRGRQSVFYILGHNPSPGSRWLLAAAVAAQKNAKQKK